MVNVSVIVLKGGQTMANNLMIKVTDNIMISKDDYDKLVEISTNYWHVFWDVMNGIELNTENFMAFMLIFANSLVSGAANDLNLSETDVNEMQEAMIEIFANAFQNLPT